METKITGTYKIYEDNGVVHLIIHEEVVLQYYHAKEINYHVKNHNGKKKHLKLLDIRSQFIMEPSAKHFFESPKVRFNMTALAVLIGSNTAQQIIDTFSEVKSKKLPIKIFVNYDEAIKWLNTFKQKNN